MLLAMCGAAGEDFCITAWRAEQDLGRLHRAHPQGTAWFRALGFHLVHTVLINSLKKKSQKLIGMYKMKHFIWKFKL